MCRYIAYQYHIIDIGEQQNNINPWYCTSNVDKPTQILAVSNVYSKN